MINFIMEGIKMSLDDKANIGVVFRSWLNDVTSARNFIGTYHPGLEIGGIIPADSRFAKGSICLSVEVPASYKDTFVANLKSSNYRLVVSGVMEL